MSPCSFGDGTVAPPALGRSIIEQQRAANKIARLLRERLSAAHYRIEAQFTVSTTRLIIHYGAQLNDTVELDFTVGEPLDDPGWLMEMAKWMLHNINEGESDFLIAHELDHFNILDEAEHCIYEFGRAV
ncbi:hypothetical protein [Pseudomonas fluorescens]|uniref:hypothetical protein n=1 Tax=Pseudomonas fluorescens TaxID=294 RepID=UPI0005FADA67|nr:hypothetical protein [Pseudomonas fluorescens]KJZ36656.1 hypothetical protein VC33_15760 [Pseudomonas fluorescens]